MKPLHVVVVIVGGAVLATVALNYFKGERQDTPMPVVARAPGGASTDSESMARMAEQVRQMEQSLKAMKLQLAAQQAAGAKGAGAAGRAAEEPEQPLDPEAQRVADADRHHEYMASVAQSFNNEKVNPGWATQASTRVTSALTSDEALKDIAHKVECRAQTCRVEIRDDGSVSKRMPQIAMGLADVLPSISAEHVDLGNGQSTMILYMSSQPLAGSGPPRK